MRVRACVRACVRARACVCVFICERACVRPYVRTSAWICVSYIRLCMRACVRGVVLMADNNLLCSFLVHWSLGSSHLCCVLLPQPEAYSDVVDRPIQGEDP